MKKNLTFLALMLIVLLSSAQNGYPKLTVLDNDTVGIFSIQQVELINLNKISYDYCVLDNKSYAQEVYDLKNIISTHEAIREAYEAKMERMRDIEGENEFQNSMRDKIDKKQKRKIKGLKVGVSVAFIGGFVLGYKIK